MAFAALPYEAEEARKLLAKRLEVRGYPTLLVLGPTQPDKERELINPNVRGLFEAGKYIEEFPYYPKTYGCLTAAPTDINGHKCVIVFDEEGDDDEQKEVQQAIVEASKQLNGLNLYWCLKPSHVSTAVREALRLPQSSSKEATMVLLDIPDRGGFYVSESKDITADAVVSFAKSPGARLQI